MEGVICNPRPPLLCQGTFLVCTGFSLQVDGGITRVEVVVGLGGALGGVVAVGGGGGGRGPTTGDCVLIRDPSVGEVHLTSRPHGGDGMAVGREEWWGKTTAGGIASVVWVGFVVHRSACSSRPFWTGIHGVRWYNLGNYCRWLWCSMVWYCDYVGGIFWMGVIKEKCGRMWRCEVFLVGLVWQKVEQCDTLLDSCDMLRGTISMSVGWVYEGTIQTRHAGATGKDKGAFVMVDRRLFCRELWHGIVTSNKTIH